jgi:hypothetical protein
LSMLVVGELSWKGKLGQTEAGLRKRKTKNVVCVEYAAVQSVPWTGANVQGAR